MGGLIPLGDASRRTRGVAVITLLLIAVNVLVFFEELAGGDDFVFAWSAVPDQIVRGHHTVTLLTSMFMHASWMHIIGNMIFLWAFGPEMEDAMGHARFLLFYLLGGLVAMLGQVLASPHSQVPCLGASGAIAAVMGVFIITYPRDRIRTLVFLFIFVRITFIPAALLIGIWFLIQLFHYGMVAHVQTGGVAYVAHIAGFVFGLAIGPLFRDLRRVASPREIDW